MSSRGMHLSLVEVTSAWPSVLDFFYLSFRMLGSLSSFHVYSSSLSSTLFFSHIVNPPLRSAKSLALFFRHLCIEYELCFHGTHISLCTDSVYIMLNYQFHTPHITVLTIQFWHVFAFIFLWPDEDSLFSFSRWTRLLDSHLSLSSLIFLYLCSYFTISDFCYLFMQIFFQWLMCTGSAISFSCINFALTTLLCMLINVS